MVGGSGENTARAASPSGSASARDAPALGILREVYERFVAVLDELGVEPMPGARSCSWRSLAALPLAVASNTREAIVRATLAASGLPTVFELVFTPAQGRGRSRRPTSTSRACEALGVDPARRSRSRTRRPGAAAARAAGMFVDRGARRPGSTSSRRTSCSARCSSSASPSSGSSEGSCSLPACASSARPTSCAARSTPSRRAAALAAASAARAARRCALPLADGGEGTLAVVCAAAAHARVERRHGPRSRSAARVRAAIGDCGDGTFLVEAAEAVGLRAARPRERDPRGARARRAWPTSCAPRSIAARSACSSRSADRRPSTAASGCSAAWARVSRRHGPAAAARRSRARPRAGATRCSQGSSSSCCTTSTSRSAGPTALRACSARRRGFAPQDIEP